MSLIEATEKETERSESFQVKQGETIVFMVGSRIMFMDVKALKILKCSYSISDEYLSDSDQILTKTNRFFVVGMKNPFSVFYEFNFKNEALEKRAPLANTRIYTALVEVDSDHIIALGGAFRNYTEFKWQFTKACEIFDITQNSWGSFPELNVARQKIIGIYNEPCRMLYAVSGDRHKEKLETIERIQLNEEYSGIWEIINIKGPSPFPAFTSVITAPYERNKIMMLGGVEPENLSPYQVGAKVILDINNEEAEISDFILKFIDDFSDIQSLKGRYRNKNYILSVEGNLHIFTENHWVVIYGFTQIQNFE